MADSRHIFTEENLIDDVGMKLSLASSVLAALHEQHCYTDRKPTISQPDIAKLVYTALQLVEFANASVQSMPFQYGRREAA